MDVEFIKALPALAQGGAWLVLAGVLIWMLREMISHMKQQDERHQKNVDNLMENHSEERKEWVSTIENTGDKFAKATSEQGDRIARAIENAIRDARAR